MLIRNYYIGQNIINNKVKIINYADTITYKTSRGIEDNQVYIIEYNNELLYATDSGLQTNNLNIFNKVIANIGYRGNITDYKLYIKEYELWKDIIYRCYSPNNNIYPYYGKEGITVDPRWCCFELFLYDLINMTNYDKFKSSNKKYDFDMSKQKNININERMYTPTKVTLKPIWQTDVGKAINIKNMTGTAQEAGSFIDNSKMVNNETIRKEYKPFKNGTYPINAYIDIINNPPNLLIPKNDDLGINIVRTLNGVTRLDLPKIKPLKREMCKILQNN